MIQMTIDMPEEALAALRADPESFARELRLAAAVKWYELRRVSQERAAGIAGLSRAEFIDALGRFGVSPFQYTAAEALEEAGGE
jgi:predicted HTH domain antitoxin